MNPLCWLYASRLGAYRDGELGGVWARGIRRHVARCPRCALALAALDRLRSLVAAVPIVPDPPEPVWETFYPRVRARLAERPGPAHEDRGPWGRRFALAPVLAAGALAVLAAVAPWQDVERERGRAGSGGPGPGVAGGPEVAVPHVVIQSIETADPESPVMVYADPNADMTVLWVFGLPRTTG